jgi:isoleucyl-tRNA synthetase
MLPVDEWLEIDRYALAMTRDMAARTQADYERYEYHPIVARLQTFASEDLGAFYLDILKDRLYTTQPDSKARRSAQCALYLVTEALLKLMAPLLSFTAEEAWKVLKRKTDGTIFTETFPALPAPADETALVDKWTRLRAVRADVQKKLEPLRERGQIGSSLQAEVELHTDAETTALLQTLGDDLKFVLITSAARATQADASNDQQIIVAPSAQPKCGRCWHWRADVGCDADHPTICGRCVSNLFGAGEPRTFA